MMEAKLYHCTSCGMRFDDSEADECVTYELLDDMYDRPPMRETFTQLGCPSCGSDELEEMSNEL